MTRIDEIKKRLSEATPGPWTFTESDETAFFENSEGCTVIPNTVSSREYYIAIEMGCADGQFIANSPSDIAYLIEQVESMRWYLKRLKDVVDTQAEDESLWRVNLPGDEENWISIGEAYVQQNLRRLHSEIEKALADLERSGDE